MILAGHRDRRRAGALLACLCLVLASACDLSWPQPARAADGHAPASPRRAGSSRTATPPHPAGSRRTANPRQTAGSRYPAGATRPVIIARASEFARSSSASSKGSKGKKKHKKKVVLSGNPLRALLAYEAMQRAYYIPGSGLYDGEPFSFLWPFSQALAATVSVEVVPHVGASFVKPLHELLVGLGDYLDTNNSGSPEGTYTSTLPAFDGTIAPPAGPGGAKYYDDNDWVALQLVRLARITHSAALLGTAEGIMAFEMQAWQESPELGCPGGIPFSNSAENEERNTVTTAPTAELAVLLYELTHNAEYLRFAERAYAWVRNCLLQPGELYADHVNRKGTVEGSLWSYNQGSMIGAGTLLYQATRNAAYLYEARQTAKGALAYYSLERLLSENPFFVAVFLRNLLYLDSVTHDPPGAIAQTYANYAWAHLRLTDDIFVFGSPPSSQLLDQAAIVQVFALLSTSPSTYF